MLPCAVTALNAVGRLDQLARENWPLQLETVEKAVIGLALQHGRELPGEVDGIADAGVHALSACRTVHMRGIAQQEDAAMPEAFGDPVMNAIGGEPVDLVDHEPNGADCFTADVLDGQCLVLVDTVLAYRSDQARLVRSIGQEQHEFRTFENDGDFAVGLVGLGFHVGDVKQLIIGAAFETGAERLADHGPGAVASGEIARLAGLDLPVGAATLR